MVTETKTARSRRTRAALLEALQSQIMRHGGFTAKEIAELVGCTTGTFWAHFESKDDAIAAVFSETLGDLVDLTRVLYGDGVSGLKAVGSDQGYELAKWADVAIDQLVEYFSTRALLYRLAISRLPEHRPIRQAFRAAEAETVALVADALRGPNQTEDAAAVTAFCQGINNPMVLHSVQGSRIRSQLARALVALVRT